MIGLGIEVYCQPHPADFVQDLDRLVRGGSVLPSSDVIVAEVEEVIDLIMGWEETLRLAGRFELLHLPLSAARWLVRIPR
jgi:hypothetical protein